MIIIEKAEDKEFFFTDSMAIVEVNNPGNAGTLGSVQSTVVWWDDAEGEMQPYHLKQNFVGYYKDKNDLPDPNSANVCPPKNGNKSIAVGGTNTALLHLKINLNKKAKLSFWIANTSYFFSAAGTSFSINGVEKENWTFSGTWWSMTYELDPGTNDLIWEKKDGFPYGYLSLDDILIYYTE
jgi:hypothetical protein